MLKSYNLKRNILVPVIILVAGTSFSFSAEKPNIKKLTSKSAAKKVANDVSSVQENEPRIPSALNKHSVGVGVGQTFVKGDFDDYGDDKITADLIYNYSASHSFDLMATFHYSKHDFKGQFVKTSGLALGFKGKAYQFDNFSPYALAGLGFYSPKVRRLVNGEYTDSKSKIVFGTHLGAGADLRLNKTITMGILGHYHNPFDVKQELGPEVEGSYFKLLITTLYSFN